MSLTTRKGKNILTVNPVAAMTGKPIKSHTMINTLLRSKIFGTSPRSLLPQQNNVAKTSMRRVIHMVELVVSPTHVVMSVKVESVTNTGEVPAHG